jgi:hypothetical protein
MGVKLPVRIGRCRVPGERVAELTARYMIPSEPNNQYEHALRRSWLSGATFTMYDPPVTLVSPILMAGCIGPFARVLSSLRRRLGR